MNFQDFNKNFVKNNIKEIGLKELINEINLFADIFTDTLILYYKILNEISKKKCQFSDNYDKEKLKNFTFYLIFEENNINFTIINLYDNIYQEIEENLQKKYIKYSNRKIEEFGVGEKWKFDENSKEISYLFSIVFEKFKKIANYKSPSKKLRAICDSSKFLTVNLENYLEKIKFPCFKDQISSDNLISLFLFIICQCKILNLYSYISFIESFSSEKNLGSIEGYYFITVKASIHYLSSC